MNDSPARHSRGVDGTFSTSEAVELAVVERSGFIESRHAGSAIVVAPDGSTIAVHGSPDAPILPRSAMKPLQAVAVMTAGADLEGAAAAIATASHAGTPAHVSLVRGLLARAGLDEGALACPAAWPSDPTSHAVMLRAGDGPSRLTMTCSGKHAAMLLACAHNGWPVSGYLEPQHPLQVHIRDVVERMTGEKIGLSAIDGCGAPVHAMSLVALARGIQRIGTASPSSPFALYRHAAQLRQAVLENPWAIDGSGRPNSVIIERLGVFAKWGAEGVMAVVAPDGTTVTLKMLDGGLRAATVVALAMLADAGALTGAAVAAVLPELGLAVLGGGEVVGGIRPSYTRTRPRAATAG
ncbi:asparaginase [Microbacterium sp. STN6]|uniref:asparaginase n=1 Tax=Microbacterium sp. STN6 TaxID=2995588 RepID=UPI0022610028|nr:asparaginase [Microbacterium sp. STN6]MCX7521199.1 asparaginase [Microbacterium sp. STN6]